MRRRLFRGTRPQVLTTSPRDPDEGRVFVWAWTQWYERVSEESGAVAFMPFTGSEQDLRRWLSEQGEGTLTDIGETEYAEMVREEFLDQAPLYPEGPELSDEKPFREQSEEDWD
ncbi:MAG: hypothetical protein IBX68_05860 [Dehalococcoidia bacterium]|nr:hypothetical protein [Dehalococcoidia bacterium]